MSSPHDPDDPRQQGGSAGWGAPSGQPQNPGYGNPPPDQQWGGQGYGTPAKPKNGAGIAALITGILGLLLSIFVIGGVLGVAAVILGFVARGAVKRGEATNGGQAIGGIVTGALAIVVSIAVLVLGVALFEASRDCFDPELSQAEAEQCIQEQLD